MCVCVAGSVREQSGSVCAADRLGGLKTTPSPAAQPGKPDPEKNPAKNYDTPSLRRHNNKKGDKIEQFRVSFHGDIFFKLGIRRKSDCMAFSNRAAGEEQTVPERAAAAASQKEMHTIPNVVWNAD